MGIYLISPTNSNKVHPSLLCTWTFPVITPILFSPDMEQCSSGYVRQRDKTHYLRYFTCLVNWLNKTYGFLAARWYPQIVCTFLFHKGRVIFKTKVSVTEAILRASTFRIVKYIHITVSPENGDFNHQTNLFRSRMQLWQMHMLWHKQYRCYKSQKIKITKMNSRSLFIQVPQKVSYRLYMFLWCSLIFYILYELRLLKVFFYAAFASGNLVISFLCWKS